MAEVTLWESQTDHRAKVIGTDGGAEYLWEPWSRWIASKGIVHETTAPYTPEHNGVGERYNRALTEQFMALLADSKLHAKLWAEAAVTVNFLANRVPHFWCDITPYEAFHNTRDVSHLREFGCNAWNYTPGDLRRKLQPRFKLGIFMRYGINQAGSRILLDDTITVIRDAFFAEGGPSGGLSSIAPTTAPATPPRSRFPDSSGPSLDDAGMAPTPTTVPGVAALIAEAVTAAKRLVRVVATSAGSAASGATDGREEDAERPSSSGDDSPGVTDTAHTSAPAPATPQVLANPPSREPAYLLPPNPARRGSAAAAWALAANGAHSPEKLLIHQAPKEHDWDLFDAAVKREVDSLWQTRPGTL